MVFGLFYFFKRVSGLQEAFQWIRSAILTFPDLSRPPNHFSGPISANFRSIFNIFWISTFRNPTFGIHLRASGSIWRPSETGGSFTTVKMQSNRRERPFYRRVAKAGRTKYRKTHGSSAGAQRHTPAKHIAQP